MILMVSLGLPSTTLFIENAFALEQGFIFSAMIWAAITVFIIEQQFAKAALWSLVGAGLAWVGLIHSYKWAIADTVVYIGWGAGAFWAISYLLLAVLLGFVAWFRDVMVLSKVE